MQAVSSPSEAASPVQDAVNASRDDVPSSSTGSVDGSDVPFDISEWQPGKVHTVHSPKEFKAYVMEKSDQHPVMLMCKAQGTSLWRALAHVMLRRNLFARSRIPHAHVAVLHHTCDVHIAVAFHAALR
jgi:hypothetical protein